MKQVYGDIKSLKASERKALNKLYDRRSHVKELISRQLLKDAANLSSQLSAQIAILIGRDGKPEYVVLGSRNRVYLPDLGRFRLDQARLRRLRLVVFIPSESKEEEIPADLITDLEKLRFDLLSCFFVNSSSQVQKSALAYLRAKDHYEVVSDRGENDRPVEIDYAKGSSDFDLDLKVFVEELEASFKSSRISTYDTAEDHAILVGAYSGKQEESEASMDELRELARTAGIEILDEVVQRRRKLDPKTLVGKGKLEEIVLHALDLGADLLIFDGELHPAQLRIITALTELRVIDRSMLILDIFAQRAVSSEGRLQVELAQLKYSLPRLTDKDTGLSRLTGGIGGRGPGETKLEISRRRARDRIADLEKRIKKISKQRGLRRERRQSRGVPVIAIVGYTNAGKSTLLNSLTKGDVFVENKLFATLDTSSRRMRFPNEREVIFVDTVGFIRELPKELINAFRATLEEVGEADLLMHVVDVSDIDMKKQIEVVKETLDSLGFLDKPRILVLNKCDKLSKIELQAIMHSLEGVAVSAVTRDGLEKLIGVLQDELSKTFKGQDPGRFTEIRQYW